MRKRNLVFIMVAVAGLAGPSFAQPTLVNGDFEQGLNDVSPPIGWTLWGSGLSDNKAGAGTYLFNPSPTEFGTYSLRSGKWSTGAADGGILQVVTGFTPSTEYTLQFRWAGGSQSASTHEVGVADGVVTDGNGGSIASVVKNDGAFSGWEGVLLSFTPPTDTVTVFIATRRTTTANQALATWVDEMTLVEGAVTTAQHELEDNNPKIARGKDTTVTMTIEGSFLDGVDEVVLAQGGVPQLTGVGLDIPDGESLTVDFPLETLTNGQTYDVVVSKTGFADRTLAGGLEILDPSVTLLVNGFFESDSTGWSYWKGWGNPQLEAGPTVCGELGGPLTGPCPLTGAGSLRLMLPNYSSTGDGGVYQTVPVVPGESLALDFAWAGFSDSYSSGPWDGYLYQTTVSWGDSIPSDGDWVGNPDTTAVHPEMSGVGNDWRFGRDDETIPINVPDDVDEITVILRLWKDRPTSTFHTQGWWDDLVLAPAVCALPIELVDNSPTEHDTKTLLTLTVTGTNLDQASSVRLYRGGVSYAGAITVPAGGPTSPVEVEFEAPPEGWEPGTYDIKVDQVGCATQTIYGGLEISCDAGGSLVVGFDALPQTEAEKHDSDVVMMTLTGTNLDLVDSIKMLQIPTTRTELGLPPREPHFQVEDPLNPGVMLDLDAAPYWLWNTAEIRGQMEVIGAVSWQDAGSITVQFDFTGKQAGKYDLVATLSDYCDVVVADAFELLLPSGNDVLVNGTFEDDDEDVTLNPAWVTTGSAEWDGPRDSGGGDDPYWGGTYPHGGQYMAGVGVNGVPSSGTIEQFIGLPQGAGQYDMTLSFWMRVWDNGDPQSILTANIMVGETPASSLELWLGTGNMKSIDGFDPWTRVTLDYSGEVSEDIAVVFDIAAVGGGTGHPVASVTLDDVQLLGITSCSDPFADADDDGDVDQDDFAVFQLCYSDDGNPFPTDPEYCSCFNRPEGDPPQGDVDIDQTDAAAFEACASGPQVPADDTCDD